jgi:hypothetical protein
MSAVTDYDTAYSGLITFRKKVFEALVSGRVKATLDANHDTLLQYGKVIDGLEIIPTLLGNVKQKGLAIKLNGVGIGNGFLAQARGNYNGTTDSFPSSSTPKVPLRDLPSVNQFVYTPPDEINHIENASLEVWANMFVLQAGLTQFVELPNAKNVFNSYYKFVPIGRFKGHADTLTGETNYTNWSGIKGEVTVLSLRLTVSGQSTPYEFTIYVMVDGTYNGTDGTNGIVPIAVFIPTIDNAVPEVIFMAGGKRISSKDTGVYASFAIAGQFQGWSKTHSAFTMHTDKILWAKSTQLTIEVNDAGMGTVNPDVGTYTESALTPVTVTGNSASGYSIKMWVLDGVQYPPASSFVVDTIVDHTLECVFMHGGILTLRPTGDGTVLQLYHYGDDHDYKCIDEALSDGDATFIGIADNSFYGRKYDLYGFNFSSIPDGAVIDYIDLFAVCRINTGGVIPNLVFTYLRAGFFSGVGDIPVTDYLQYRAYTRRWTLDPANNSAWTKANLLTSQFGVMLEQLYVPQVPPFNTVMCTQFWIEIGWH